MKYKIDNSGKSVTYKIKPMKEKTRVTRKDGTCYEVKPKPKAKKEIKHLFLSDYFYGDKYEYVLENGVRHDIAAIVIKINEIINRLNTKVK